ncbi:MAG TPA: DNA polymerase IV [Bacillota bacterium]|nr:DNA polymerase IV [Bacillota bacterium]HPT34501.1 DNA polymerase IV [Bacillota bacterium]HPZ65327.1 DNA polymerase IV [Bacillota bacterium]HQD06072.1 DNA polymerase IV [Bacillota bacterium]
MRDNKEILLCDLDAFFASVEQLDHPHLRGKPVIVGGDPEGRGVVSTCSYEARPFGVRSAMPVKKALQLCPEAILRPVNLPRYKAVSRQVRRILSRFTPELQFVSIDEAYLAVEKGAGLETAEAVRRAVREELGLPLSVGVSVNKLLAKIACELVKPDRIGSLWPEEVPERLWPLPVSVIPGVGPATREELGRYGIRTVGDLARFPRASLVRLLGSRGVELHQYAHGIDHRSLEEEQEAKSISEEVTFPRDLFDGEDLLLVLQELSAEVGYRLRAEGLTARTITLKLRFADFRTVTRSRTLAEAVDSDAAIYQTAKELFLRHAGPPPWRLVGVKASGLERGRQIPLFQLTPEGEKERRLLQVKDRLREKYGRDILFQAGKLNKKED